MDRFLTAASQTGHSLSLDIYYPPASRTLRQRLTIIRLRTLDTHAVTSHLKCSILVLGSIVAAFITPLEWILTKSISDEMPVDAKIPLWVDALNWIYEAAWKVSYVVEIDILLCVSALLYINRKPVCVFGLYVLLLAFVSASLLVELGRFAASWIWGKVVVAPLWRHLQYSASRSGREVNVEEAGPPSTGRSDYGECLTDGAVSDLQKRVGKTHC